VDFAKVERTIVATPDFPSASVAEYVAGLAVHFTLVAPLQAATALLRSVVVAVGQLATRATLHVPPTHVLEDRGDVTVAFATAVATLHATVV